MRLGRGLGDDVLGVAVGDLAGGPVETARDSNFRIEIDSIEGAGWDRKSLESRQKLGWETGIRTPIKWSRATRPTVERSPNEQ